MIFVVKFFGSKDEKGQIRQIKMNVDAPTEAEVEEILSRRSERKKQRAVQTSIFAPLSPSTLLYHPTHYD